MPYTPPSHRSPASSAPPSPEISRRSSFHGTGVSNGGGGVGASPRLSLPRSASYLTRHRRTPSAPTAPTGTGSMTAASTPSETTVSFDKMTHSSSAAVRQSPPPRSDAFVPPGAIISPPESQSNSEDEGIRDQDHGRKIDNLEELKNAISAIPQCREPLSTHVSAGDLHVSAQTGERVEEKSTAEKGGLVINTVVNAPAITRRISHSRSHTDSSIIFSKSADASLNVSEDSEEDDTLMSKPPMVRKKSGELVRPALRPAAHRRPSSMPGTPTYSKAVHFDSHLEHVRHFLQVDRPLAVSASSSPAENYESDTEYPFPASNSKPSVRSPPFVWELAIKNFPQETPLRIALPVRVERVWMSNDHKSLVGSIAVSNLDFHKTVVCRFTFDYWKTTSEVTAEFSHEIKPNTSHVGRDRFQFNIKLSDLANLESKTLYFCVRYNVNGMEYWDNNNATNFQVDFSKRMMPQNGKNSFQRAPSRLNTSSGSLPRSTRRSNSTSMPRPKSMPVGSIDDFSHGSGLLDFNQPIHEYLGEYAPPTFRLKSPVSSTSLASDNIANKLTAPSGLAFASRYDFGASLDAVKQANRDGKGSPRTSEGHGMKSGTMKSTFGPLLKPAKAKTDFTAPITKSPVGTQASGTGSPASTNIAAASYEEIVHKYCFFNGSKQSSPQAKDGTLPLRNGKYDGVSEESINKATSAHGSPDLTDRAQHNALRHALHQNLSPYFQGSHTMGASPAESPPASHHSLRPSVTFSPQTTGSTSPSRMGGDYNAFVGTSPSDSEYAHDTSMFPHTQLVSHRFPFTADTHASAAIRG